MDDFITAPAIQSTGDYGHADQEGVMLTPDTRYVCMVHPPFICVNNESRAKLEGLKPPSDLHKDWFNEILKEDVTFEEAWVEVDYENRYLDHIKSSEDAQHEFFKISAAMGDGDLCLLCMEHTDKWCIRRLVREYILEEGLP